MKKYEKTMEKLNETLKFKYSITSVWCGLKVIAN